MTTVVAQSVWAQTVLAQAVDAEVVGATGSGAAEFWVFWIMAPLSLAAALAVVVLKNPVHAALMLVLNFFTFAVFYAILQGQFLATIQIIVYAGAIMILFLFVLMLLGVDQDAATGPSRLKGQRIAAILMGSALFIALTAAVAGPFMGTDSACNTSEPVLSEIIDQGEQARPCLGLEAANADGSTDADGFSTAEDVGGGNVEQIGFLLFGKYVWPFEVTSVLLVVAAIGAMVLGKRKDNLADLTDVGVADPPGVPHELVVAGRVPALEAGQPPVDDESPDDDPIPLDDGPLDTPPGDEGSRQ